jgi:hypothetical protein
MISERELLTRFQLSKTNPSLLPERFSLPTRRLNSLAALLHLLKFVHSLSVCRCMAARLALEVVGRAARLIFPDVTFRVVANRE